MQSIDVIKNINKNKNDISNINYELSKTENTKYATENGIKEFSCKDGYVDNVVIEGLTKILNADNQECGAGEEGAKLVSVGQGDKIEVLTRGVNIFDGLYESGAVNSSGILVPNDLRERTINYILVEPNTKYYTPVTTNVYQYDYNKNFVGHIPLSGGGVFTTSDNTRYIKFYVDKGLMGTLQINKGESSLPYQKPQYDKKQISTTLRSLPNGVKDTIEKRGNKYVKVQRCGEVVLNGGENWELGGQANDVTIKPTLFLTDMNLGNLGNVVDTNLFCDKFKAHSIYDSTNLVEGIYISSSNTMHIRISKAKLSSTDLVGFKAWLKSNPVTVVYELKTPIITELPNFNPQTYSDNTTLLINSGVIQAEADFEVTNSMGSDIEVMKDKLSDVYDYVDRELVSEAKRLKNILISKNVEVSEEDKMSDLIGKVRGLENNDANKFWIYKEGKEYVDIVQGDIIGGTVYKRETYLELNALNNGNVAQYNTSIIDLTPYSRVWVEWQNDGYGSCSASSFRTNGSIFSKSDKFEKRIDCLDISSISGNKYINIESYSYGYGQPNNLKIYKIWLEK